MPSEPHMEGKRKTDCSPRRRVTVRDFLLNARASYDWNLKNGSYVRFNLAVNNLLNHQYRLNAWVGDWADDYSSSTCYYYYHSRAYLHQPGLNFMAGVTVGF